MESLKGLKVAILITDGFEEVEMVKPRQALDEAGAETRIVSPKEKDRSVRAWNHIKWSAEYPVDVPLDEAQPQDFHALLLPGGVMSPDALRMQPQAVAFVKAFFDAGKPVAAICHGPWTIIEAGVAPGRRIASWPSLKPTFAMPAHNGWIRKSWWTKIWSPAGIRTTFPPSPVR